MYIVSISGKFYFDNLLSPLYKLMVCACVCPGYVDLKEEKIKIQKYIFLI